MPHNRKNDEINELFESVEVVICYISGIAFVIGGIGSMTYSNVEGVTEITLVMAASALMILAGVGSVSFGQSLRWRRKLQKVEQATTA